MKHKGSPLKLKKALGLVDLTFYGVGIILGAGIYALIGEGAGIAHNSLWLSFVIAGIIAAFTGLSFCELSSRYSKDAAEYNYMQQGFRRRSWSFLIQWALIVSGVIAIATVSLGFGGYLAFMAGGDKVFYAGLLILALSALNYYGIKESARFNMVSTLIEGGGLVLIVLIGAWIAVQGQLVAPLFEWPGKGLDGVLAAVGLIFFAYIGFEDVVNISEETRNARKTVPKALLLSIGVSTLLYILVSVLATSAVGWEVLSATPAPLAKMAENSIPQAALLMGLIALFATANTVLALLVSVSRMVYGMACQNSISKVCSTVSQRGTPHVAIALAGLFSLLGLGLGGIGTVAKLADIGVFITFFGVNMALIAIRYKHPDSKPFFKTPFNLAWFPVLAGLGALSSIGMLLYFEWELLALELGVLIAGYIVYWWYAHHKD
ncbi:MAG: amino acid permease [Candidatus Diapherotrites archaeon]|nr:amino acid permease [Candidatus Diapherotrites archaeon]